MTANIFGDRFFGRTGPAWHEIGTTDPNITSCVKAVKKAKLDFNIFLAPVSGQVTTPIGTQLVNVPNKMMILREPTHDDPEHRFLGFASPDYGIIQNIDVAKAMDVLTDTWPCETVGALGVGETVFMTLDAGMFKIKGEDVRSYFLVTDTRDGGTSMKIALTPVRVVCQNTLVTGLKQSMVSVTLEHVAGISKALEARLALVRRMTTARDLTIKVFEEMAKYTLKKSEVEFVLNATYPLPKKPKKVDLLEDMSKDEAQLVGVLYDEASRANELWAYYCSRSQILKDAASELYEKHNDEFSKTAKTSWGLFNAVVESADFRRGSDSIAESCLFGARSMEKKRAFSALQNVMVR